MTIVTLILRLNNTLARPVPSGFFLPGGRCYFSLYFSWLHHFLKQGMQFPVNLFLNRSEPVLVLYTGYIEYSNIRDIIPVCVQPTSDNFRDRDSMIFSYAEFRRYFRFPLSQTGSGSNSSPKRHLSNN